MYHRDNVAFFFACGVNFVDELADRVACSHWLKSMFNVDFYHCVVPFLFGSSSSSSLARRCLDWPTSRGNLEKIYGWAVSIAHKTLFERAEIAKMYDRIHEN